MPARNVYRVFPIFAVRDLEAAMRYYREKLGFEIAWTFGEPAQRAGAKLDEIELHLVGPGPGVALGLATVYCHMTGLDAYYADCRARGATIAMELGERPWGVRDFRVTDPDGNRLGFAELSGSD